MFNKAYEIFFTWWGMFDKSIIGFGVVLLVVCALLAAMRTCAFEDSTALMEYCMMQKDALGKSSLALVDDPAVTAFVHGWFTPAFTNCVQPYDPTIWKFPYDSSWKYAWLTNAAVWLSIVAWFLVWAILAVVRHCIMAFWYFAHALKANTGSILDTRFAHVNLTVVVMLMLSYGAFTRTFLDINRWTLADWSLDHGGASQTCNGNSIPAPDYVPALMGLNASAKGYQSALDAMAAKWRSLSSTLYAQYVAASTKAGAFVPRTSDFRDYLATHAAETAVSGSITTYNAAFLLHDWLVRVQVNLQLSDADYNLLLTVPMTNFYGIVPGTASGESEADQTRLMGYMVYDADFMQNIKSSYSDLYTAMASVRDLTPEIEFSNFFSRQAALAVTFIAVIAYFMLLRWNDVVVYYLLLATLVAAGGAAFGYVVLRMLRHS